MQQIRLLFHKLPTEDSGLATHLGPPPPPPGSYATASWFNKPVSFILFTPLKCDWRLREVGRLFTFNYFFFHNLIDGLKKYFLIGVLYWSHFTESDLLFSNVLMGLFFLSGKNTFMVYRIILIVGRAAITDRPVMSLGSWPHLCRKQNGWIWGKFDI